MDISATYFHKMSVSRFGDTKDEWGGTKQAYVPIPALQFITCGYSQSSRTMNAIQTVTTNNITYNPKIFCDPTLDIKAGDRITVNYGSKVIGKFQAGEPYVYDSHQEVPLIKDNKNA